MQLLWQVFCHLVPQNSSFWASNTAQCCKWAHFDDMSPQVCFFKSALKIQENIFFQNYFFQSSLTCWGCGFIVWWPSEAPKNIWARCSKGTFLEKTRKNTDFFQNEYRTIAEKNRKLFSKLFFLDFSERWAEWRFRTLTHVGEAPRNDYFKSFYDKRRKIDEIDVCEGVFALQMSQIYLLSISLSKKTSNTKVLP